MIKGIGPVMARRLVSAFGEKTSDVIENSTERLLEVSGIGEKRVEMIKYAWEEQKEIRDVMVFLQGYGVSPAYAVRIYKHYGNDAIKIVKENPYRLAMDIFGIGFITADKIAEKLGIASDSPIRAEAGTLYVLHGLADDGHIYYPYESLVKKCADVLDVDEAAIPRAIDSIASQKKSSLKNSELGTRNSELVKHEPFSSPLHVAELGIVNRLKALFSYPKQMRLINIDEAIEWTQKP